MRACNSIITITVTAKSVCPKPFGFEVLSKKKPVPPLPPCDGANTSEHCLFRFVKSEPPSKKVKVDETTA
eukprot:8718441-Lingulodinium_polyedra.AAC.1